MIYYGNLMLNVFLVEKDIYLVGYKVYGELSLDEIQDVEKLVIKNV